MTGRARFLTVLAALAIGCVLTASALAVTPKPGRHYETVTQGLSVIVIALQVDDGAITSMLGNDLNCENESGVTQGFALDKVVKVASSGKFNYAGKADNTIYGSGPRKIKVAVKGKFTSSKKAKGSFSIDGCPGRVSFQTIWEP